MRLTLLYIAEADAWRQRALNDIIWRWSLGVDDLY